MDQRDDWSWRAWPRASRLRHMAVAVLVALGLVATGSALTLGVRAASAPSTAPPSTNAVRVTLPGLPAIDAAKVTRLVDPAVVDVNTIALTPAGPTNVAGTGMILTPDGYIVTNNHVVEGATTIKVSIPGRRQHYLASFVGADPDSDVAVIKVSGLTHLPTVSFGNPDHLAVGDSVLAIGNSLGLGGTPSVTAGIISALHRTITATSETGADAEHLSGMIEADAPIAPGNSGGPLVDAAGVVIGMNTASSPSGRKLDSSVAFALPSKRVLGISREIVTGSHRDGIVLGRSAYLGIEGTTVALVGQAAKDAVNVIQVEPGTPAARAGLEPGDLILRLGGRPVSSMRALTGLLSHYAAGEGAQLVFEGGGVDRSVSVRLVAGPAA